MDHSEAAQKFKIRGIPANMVERFWNLAEPYIKRALDHTSGELSPANIKMYCKDRILQLWLISENERVIAAVTTQIINFPQRKHCRVATLGGSKAVEWLGLLDEVLTAWAHEQGCNGIEAFVRKGFVPALVEFGYKPRYSVVFKEILQPCPS